MIVTFFPLLSSLSSLLSLLSPLYSLPSPRSSLLSPHSSLYSLPSTLSPLLSPLSSLLPSLSSLQCTFFFTLFPLTPNPHFFTHLSLHSLLSFHSTSSRHPLYLPPPQHTHNSTRKLGYSMSNRGDAIKLSLFK